MLFADNFLWQWVTARRIVPKDSFRQHDPIDMQHLPIWVTLTSTRPWPEVKSWPLPSNVTIYMLRRYSTRETLLCYFFPSHKFTSYLQNIVSLWCHHFDHFDSYDVQFQPWPENNLNESCSSFQAVSNPVHRLSPACVVFKILDPIGWRVDVLSLSAQTMPLS